MHMRGRCLVEMDQASFQPPSVLRPFHHGHASGPQYLCEWDGRTHVSDFPYVLGQVVAAQGEVLSHASATCGSLSSSTYLELFPCTASRHGGLHVHGDQSAGQLQRLGLPEREHGRAQHIQLQLLHHGEDITQKYESVPITSTRDQPA